MVASIQVKMFFCGLKKLKIEALAKSLTSIDRDGTGKGFDIDLIKKISDSIKIPLIAHGGASSTSHIIESIELGKSDAVAVSSMLHYSAIKKIK